MLPRLLSEIAVQFPLHFGPILLLIFSLIVQTIPIAILLSNRFSQVIKPLPIRILLAALYVALPNSSEVNLHFVSVQWQLALIAFLIIISPIPNTQAGKVLESIGLVIAGLTGPFAVLLVPIAVGHYLVRKNRAYNYRIALLIICAAIDGITYLATFRSARHGAHSLGASISVLLHLIGGQIVLGGMVGMNGYSHLYRYYWSHEVTLLAGIFYVLVTLYVIARAPLELRLFQIFTLLIFTSELVSPQISYSAPQWVVMLAPGAGNRYFYFPILSLAVSLIWLIGHFYQLTRPTQDSPQHARQPGPAETGSPATRYRHSASPGTPSKFQKRPNRLTALVLTLLFSLPFCIMALVGVPLDWEFPSYPSTNLAPYQAKLSSGAEDKVTIPIEPKGVVMVLDTKSSK